MRFEVHDTGIGIAPEMQKQIFSSFSQANASTSRKYRGTGLGLAISQRLVTMMAGQMGVSSEVSRGSTFWFTAQFKRQSLETSAKITAPSDRLNMRLLVVSSHQKRRHVLHHQILSWGMSNDSAENGIQVLKILHDSAAHGKLYDAVIIDMTWPDSDGLELIRQIKADPHIRSACLIGLLPLDTPNGTEELEEAGMEAYLTEPICKSTFYNILITFKKVRTVRIPIYMSQSLPDDKTPVQFPCHVLLVEDNPVNKELSQEMLEICGCTVDIAENGEEAVTSFSLKPYGLIFMDYQMPVMDGFEVVRHIRQEKTQTREVTSPLSLLRLMPCRETGKNVWVQGWMTI